MINLPQRYKIYIDKGSINFIHQNEVLQNEEYVENFEVFMENTADKILKNKIYRKYDIWIRCFQLPENYQSFIELFKPVAAAGGIVENEYHEILFIQRKKKWDLPKGHVELGESTVDAAVREVQEECGLQEVELLNSKPIFELQHIYFEYDCNTPSIKTTTWYGMKATKSAVLTPQAEEGITAIEWILAPYVKVLKSQTYSSIVDIVHMLQL